MATFGVWFTTVATGNGGLDLPSDTQGLLFMLVSVPGVLAIAMRLYAPALALRMVPSVPAPEPIPAAV